MSERYRFNPSYVGNRPDILAFVPPTVKKVLDVGCSTGRLGYGIKARNSANVVGIELDPQMSQEAATRLDRVILGDVENLRLADFLGDLTFDCMIYGDVLEHLKDPWSVLTNLSNYLDSGGYAIASIPNIRHYTSIMSLISGNWPYRDRGIHDRTHLRFFTLANIRQMFCDSGFRITKLQRKYKIVDRPHRINGFSKFLGFWPCREFVTFQYLVKAQKR